MKISLIPLNIIILCLSSKVWALDYDATLNVLPGSSKNISWGKPTLVSGASTSPASLVNCSNGSISKGYRCAFEVKNLLKDECKKERCVFKFYLNSTPQGSGYSCTITMFYTFYYDGKYHHILEGRSSHPDCYFTGDNIQYGSRPLRGNNGTANIVLEGGGVLD